MRTCRTCNQSKPLDCFYITGSGWRQINCSVCQVKKGQNHYYTSGRRERLMAYRRDNKAEVLRKEKEWRDANPDRSKGKILRQYWPGSTWQEALENFRALVLAQNNLCKICQKPETCKFNRPPYKVRDLCVDHCHKTGKVRGLLCDSCNVLLGRAKDCPEICLSAAVYLAESEAA